MPYVVGQLVRPKLTRKHLDKSDALQDWRGKVCAQGRVQSIDAIATDTSAQYWNPNTSTNVDETSAVVQLYTVRVWNVATRAFEDATYPESELDPGTLGIETIVNPILDPSADDKAFNLCATRI